MITNENRAVVLTSGLALIAESGGFNIDKSNIFGPSDTGLSCGLIIGFKLLSSFSVSDV